MVLFLYGVFVLHCVCSVIAKLCKAYPALQTMRASRSKCNTTEPEPLPVLLGSAAMQSIHTHAIHMLAIIV